MPVSKVKLVGTIAVSASGASSNITIPAAGCAVGNTLVLVGMDLAANNAAFAVSDSKGHVWTKRTNTAGFTNGTSNTYIVLYDATLDRALVSGDVVTVTRYAGAVKSYLWLYEYSTLAFNQRVYGNTGTTTAVSGGAASSAPTDAMALGVFYSYQDPGSIVRTLSAVGAGYTNEGTGGAVLNAITDQGGWCSKIGSIAAAEKATGTLSGAITSNGPGLTAIYTPTTYVAPPSNRISMVV